MCSLLCRIAHLPMGQNPQLNHMSIRENPSQGLHREIQQSVVPRTSQSAERRSNAPNAQRDSNGPSGQVDRNHRHGDTARFFCETAGRPQDQISQSSLSLLPKSPLAHCTRTAQKEMKAKHSYKTDSGDAERMVKQSIFLHTQVRGIHLLGFRVKH